VPRAKKKEVVVEPDPRDFVMARLGAGRAAAQSAINAIDDAMNLFVNPGDDKGGNERIADIEEALEALGVACRALEAVEESIEDVDMSEGEPWDEDVDEDEEDDEEDDEDEEDGD
jgi:hypothetical protein